MAITEDAANSPAAVHATTTSGTTGAFTPQANTLVVVRVAADGSSVSATTVTVSDSGSHTWTRLVRENANGVSIGGCADVWVSYFTTSPGSITVTASWAGGGGSNGGDIYVRSLLGAAQTQNGATGIAAGSSIAPTFTLTPTQIGSRIYFAAFDYTTNATLTANGNSVSDDQFPDSTNGDTWAAGRSSADTSSLSSTTYGYTNANAAYMLAGAEILAAATTLTFPSNLEARRRLFTPPRLPRGRAATPVRAQVNPPYPFVEVKQPRQPRGILPRRGHSFMPVPAQVVIPPPPYPPNQVRPRLRLARIWRGRAAQVVPPQVAVTPPAYPPPAVRARVKGVRLFRGRTAQPPPVQPFVAARPRPVVKVVLPRRSRAAVAPPLQQPAPLFTRVKLRLAGIFRGRTRQVVPAQVILIAPPYPPQAVRVRRNQFAARRHRGGVEGWMVPGVHLCVTPRPNTGTTSRPGSGTTAYNTATTARPNTGVTARPNTGTTQDPC